MYTIFWTLGRQEDSILLRHHRLFHQGSSGKYLEYYYTSYDVKKAMDFAFLGRNM
jgi:hypothetical protein